MLATYDEALVAERLVDTVNSVIDGLTLPPNMRMRRADISYVDGNIYCGLNAWWDDIYKPGEKAQTYSSLGLEPRLGDLDEPQLREHIERRIYDLARKLWFHELHEHFKFDGKHYIDPHPPGGGFQ